MDGNKTTKLAFKRFFRLIKNDKENILRIYLYAFFQGIVYLSLPLGIQAIINLIMARQVTTSWILLVLLVLVGLLIHGWLQVKQMYITESIQQKIFTRSAFELTYRIPHWEPEYIKKSYPPELVNRFFDTINIQKGFSKLLFDFTTAALQILFGLILLGLYHPIFLAISIILFGGLLLVWRFTGEKGLRSSLDESDYKYKTAFWLQEVARTKEVFYDRNAGKRAFNRTDDYVSNYLDSRKNHFKVLVKQFYSLLTLKILIAGLLLIPGGLLVINDSMNLGQFVAGEIIIIMLMNAVEKLILSMETLYDTLTASEKLGKLVDIPLVDEKSQEKTSRGSFTLNLFDTENKKKGSLNITKGQKIKIKLPHKSDIQNVSFTIEQNDKAPFNIGLLNGTENIFDGTIRQNVSIYRDLEDSEIIQLLKKCGYKFTLDEEATCSKHIQPKGTNIDFESRHAIIAARCLSMNPEIICWNEDTFHEEFLSNQILEYIISNEIPLAVITKKEHLNLEGYDFDKLYTWPIDFSPAELLNI
ncbi:ABC transporter transmembrane domain-containing protein [Mangrovivirga sp. M17]|uniref:ABC transporter transmembrane domain-containing protein n=1 Tax=Mangrovivirga halotolerans TaxID=2993936 RepID=A0ABT3RPJ7_9BACT|nr:ABC transporter transmembrane domain-containing protein [Mangrovivirga halotolerans]MCX2743551.1 ABC transporter transmembrane domain-containing protein [Mangrovivirga halotolerans]